MKDFCDLSQIARHCSLDGAALADAIRATFVRRAAPVPDATPIALTEAFHGSTRKRRDWLIFLRRHSLTRRLALADACKDIECFLMPVPHAIVAGRGRGGAWRDTRWGQ